MASYLAAVDVGKFIARDLHVAGGVAIRNYFATDLAAAAHAAFARTGEVIDYFASLFGPYPFAVYGVVVPDADTGGGHGEPDAVAVRPATWSPRRMADPTDGRDRSSRTSWPTSGSGTA